MADFRGDDTFSWTSFVDALAGPLRLEPTHRQASGLVSLLHLVATLWGEIALLRAAERLVRHHYFDINAILSARPSHADTLWFRGLLRRCHPGDAALLPLPAPFLKPAAPALSNS